MNNFIANFDEERQPLESEEEQLADQEQVDQDQDEDQGQDQEPDDGVPGNDMIVQDDLPKVEEGEVVQVQEVKVQAPNKPQRYSLVKILTENQYNRQLWIRLLKCSCKPINQAPPPAVQEDIEGGGTSSKPAIDEMDACVRLFLINTIDSMIEDLNNETDVSSPYVQAFKENQWDHLEDEYGTYAVIANGDMSVFLRCCQWRLFQPKLFLSYLDGKTLYDKFHTQIKMAWHDLPEDSDYDAAFQQHGSSSGIFIAYSKASKSFLFKRTTTGKRAAAKRGGTTSVTARKRRVRTRTLRRTVKKKRAKRSRRVH